MADDLEREARELLRAVNGGYKDTFTGMQLSVVIEALRLRSDTAFHEGVIAEQEYQDRVKRGVFPPGSTPQRRISPYTKEKP